MFFNYSLNPLDLLEQYEYVPEFKLDIEEIPIIENNNFYIINYEDLQYIEENYNINNALDYICELHHIYPDQVKVIIDEHSVILDTNQFNTYNNIIIRPLSDMDHVYKIIMEYVNSFYNTGDEKYINILLEDEELSNSTPPQNISAIPANKDDINFRRRRALVATGFGALGLYFAKKGYDQYRQKHKGSEKVPEISIEIPKVPEVITDKVPIKKDIEKEIKDEKGETKIEAIQIKKNEPTTFIAKKIASLRRVYRDFMVKATQSTDPGIKAKLKRIAAKILTYIDKALAWLQEKTDRKPK